MGPKCNFTFLVTSLVYDLENKSAYGWGIDVLPKHTEATLKCVIPCDVSANSSALRQYFMKLGHSIVCRMGSDDFLAMVDQDLRKNDDIPTQFVTKFVGKVYIPQLDQHYWVFPGVVLDTHGVLPKEEIVNLKNCEPSARLPSVAQGIAQVCKGKEVDNLRRLSSCIRAVYGQKFMHVLHLLTSVLKGIHHDTIMDQEHFVPVANIFGPANTGKTMACAIALQLLNSHELMIAGALRPRWLTRRIWSKICWLSGTIRATPVPHKCPRLFTRPLTASQAHYLARNAALRSSLIIGTQQRCLGMPYNGVNVATFSRLSHISMENETGSKPNGNGFDTTKEPALQDIMKNLGNIFPFASHILLRHQKSQKNMRSCEKYHW